MFFGDIDYPSPLETILGQNTSLYLDTSCQFEATPTLKTGYLIDWKVTIPGFHPKFFQDGELWYTTMGLASRTLAFEATMEFDDEYTKQVLWDACYSPIRLPIYVRLQAIGPYCAAPPARYTATIDMVLELESFEPLDERDGNDTIKFTARSVYDLGCETTDNVGEWSIKVINQDATLPI